MDFKQRIKYVLGYLRSKIMHIETKGQVYIGKGVKVTRGNITICEGACIRPYAALWHCGEGIEIGEGSEVGERCRISVAHHLKIGKKVLLSPNVYITDCDHAYEDITVPIIDQGIVQKENLVEIKDGAYIGINTVIVGNVTVGLHCVIGANSVVTKSIPDYCVAVGCPAKVIKRFNLEIQKWELL